MIPTIEKNDSLADIARQEMEGCGYARLNGKPHFIYQAPRGGCASILPNGLVSPEYTRK